MRTAITLLVLIFLSGCSALPITKIDAKTNPNICNDCDDCKTAPKGDPCHAVKAQRECDLCDDNCCNNKPKGDRCCCLHPGRRDDCFTVCVAKNNEEEG